MEIDFYHDGEELIEKYHIAKNKHGIFFNMNTKSVLQIQCIEYEVRMKHPNISSSWVKEVISYIDIACPPCDLSSECFRKSKTKYGLYCKKKKKKKGFE